VTLEPSLTLERKAAKTPEQDLYKRTRLSRSDMEALELFVADIAEISRSIGEKEQQHALRAYARCYYGSPEYEEHIKQQEEIQLNDNLMGFLQIVPGDLVKIRKVQPPYTYAKKIVLEKISDNPNMGSYNVHDNELLGRIDGHPLWNRAIINFDDMHFRVASVEPKINDSDPLIATLQTEVITRSEQPKIFQINFHSCGLFIKLEQEYKRNLEALVSELKKKSVKITPEGFPGDIHQVSQENHHWNSQWSTDGAANGIKFDWTSKESTLNFKEDPQEIHGSKKISEIENFLLTTVLPFLESAEKGEASSTLLAQAQMFVWSNHDTINTLKKFKLRERAQGIEMESKDRISNIRFPGQSSLAVLPPRYFETKIEPSLQRVAKYSQVEVQCSGPWTYNFNFVYSPPSLREFAESLRNCVKLCNAISLDIES
jgi:hypothetical protein